MDATQAMDFLVRQARQQQGPIARYAVAEDIVWLRKSLPHHALWVYTPLRWLARFLRVKVLQPVPNPGGRVAVAREARRLRALDAAGVVVPRLLAVNDESLLMADVDPEGRALQLEQALKRADSADRCLALFAQGVAGIADVHARQQYLSQAFARNILRLADGSLAFIDFEDDPGEVLPLPVCQARDWLCYVFSTAGILDQHDHALAQAVTLLDQVLQQAAPGVSSALLRACRRLSWLRRLPLQGLGSDGRRLVAAGEFMARLLSTRRAA